MKICAQRIFRVVFSKSCEGFAACKGQRVGFASAGHHRGGRCTFPHLFLLNFPTENLEVEKRAFSYHMMNACSARSVFSAPR